MCDVSLTTSLQHLNAYDLSPVVYTLDLAVFTDIISMISSEFAI